jgi:hypothetical protein
LLFMNAPAERPIEIVVPKYPQTARRLNGFFKGIGWTLRMADGDERAMVWNETPWTPQIVPRDPPALVYLLSTDQADLDRFTDTRDMMLDRWSQGPRLAEPEAVGNPGIIVPSVVALRGMYGYCGKQLAAASQLYRDGQEITAKEEWRMATSLAITDPFNYRILVMPPN